jgi:uncharacterized protein (DUF2141 family)
MLALLAAVVLQTAPLAVPAQPAPLAAPPLSVLVEGVRDSEGYVRVDVCTQDTFLGRSCQTSGVAPAQKGVTEVVLTHLAPGVYAIQAFHDRNGDGRLNRGPLGIPVEEVGFSKSPPLGLHGPSFQRAAFVHGDVAQTVDVHLNRFW